MTLQSALLKTRAFAACLTVPFTMSSQDGALCLKHGVYVLKSVDCKDPVSASMKNWDGIGFSGPHSSKCTTQVLSHHGSHFRLSTSCTAIGDGTLGTSGYVDTFSMIRLSATSFAINTAAESGSTYKRCGPKSPRRVRRPSEAYVVERPNGPFRQVEI